MRNPGLALVALAAVALAVSLHAAQQAGSAEIRLQAAINKEAIEGDLKGAIVDFQRIVNTPGVSRAVAATALLHLGQCHEKLGTAEARTSYERILKDYADQPDVVRQARARLSALATTAARSREEALEHQTVVGPSYHFRGALSPNERYIAYCCAGVYDVVTGRQQELKVSMFPGAPPRFSPDSEHLAYVTEGSNAPPQLRVVKRAGSDDRVVFTSPDVKNVSLFDWTVDGKDLLVRLAREDKTTELALVPAAGGDARRVASPAPCGAGPDEGRLSPDGRHFAYRAQAGGPGGAWTTRVLVLDGGFDAPLVDKPANAWSIGWTGDGRFAFYSDDKGSEGIWAMKVIDGRAQGLPERLAGSLGDRIQPVGLAGSGAFYFHTSLLDFQIHLMSVAPISGGLRPSVVLSGSQSPDWSPDGRSLAYAQTGTGLVHIRTLATGASRTLATGLPGAIMALSWFPDGGSLAAQGVGPGGSMGSIGLRRVDLASGSLSDILLGPVWRQFGANATFSADGKTVTYKAFDAAQGTTWVTRDNLETRQQDVLFALKRPQFLSAFAVLARTGQIAVAVQEADTSCSLGLLDPATRDVRTIHRTAQGLYIPASIPLAWMPDGRSLLFVTAPSATKGSPMSLFRVSVAGGQPEKLFEAETIFQVKVHPDGTQIALDTRSYNMETRVLKGLFRVPQ